MLEDWPSQSPDLNLIEQIRFRNHPNNLKNLKELEHALEEEWNKIPQKVFENLIENMPQRIQACIRSNGWPTKY